MTETTPASNDYWNPLRKMTMTICCPECRHVYKVPDSGVEYCPLCGWKGRWKQETAQEDEITREIEHLALRSGH